MADFLNLRRAGEFGRFLAVGGASALFNTVVIVLLTELLRINYLVSYAVCFVAVTFFGFVMNRSWSFRAGGKAKSREVGNYYLITIASTIVAMAASRFLVEFGMPYPPAVFLSAGLVAPFNFVSHRAFSFGLRTTE